MNDDTLKTVEAKIHKAEHELYPWVIEQIALGNMKIVDKTDISGSSRFVEIKDSTAVTASFKSCL